MKIKIDCIYINERRLKLMQGATINVHGLKYFSRKGLTELLCFDAKSAKAIEVWNGEHYNRSGVEGWYTLYNELPDESKTIEGFDANGRPIFNKD